MNNWSVFRVKFLINYLLFGYEFTKISILRASLLPQVNLPNFNNIFEITFNFCNCLNSPHPRNSRNQGKLFEIISRIISPFRSKQLEWNSRWNLQRLSAAKKHNSWNSADFLLSLPLPTWQQRIFWVCRYFWYHRSSLNFLVNKRRNLCFFMAA